MEVREFPSPNRHGPIEATPERTGGASINQRFRQPIRDGPIEAASPRPRPSPRSGVGLRRQSGTAPLKLGRSHLRRADEPGLRRQSGTAPLKPDLRPWRAAGRRRFPSPIRDGPIEAFSRPRLQLVDVIGFRRQSGTAPLKRLGGQELPRARWSPAIAFPSPSQGTAPLKPPDRERPNASFGTCFRRQSDGPIEARRRCRDRPSRAVSVAKSGDGPH